MVIRGAPRDPACVSSRPLRIAVPTSLAILLVDVAWALLRRAPTLDAAMLLPIALAAAAVIAYGVRAGRADRHELVAHLLVISAALVGTLALPIASKLEAARRLREEAVALASVVDDPWLAPLAEEHGVASVGGAPLVAPGAEPTVGTWCAHERDGDPRAPLGAVAGLVVASREDGSLELDDAHLALPDPLRARDRAAVRWVAFARRSSGADLDDALGRPHLAPHGDRIDLRIVDLARGERIARVSCARVASGAPSDASIAGAIEQVLLTGAGEPPEPPPPVWSTGSCPRPERWSMRDPLSPACVHGGTPRCVDACESGDAAACRVTAGSADHRDPDHGASWLRVACERGSARGCGDFASSLLDRGDDAARCAMSLHETGCEAGDDHACGMYGVELARGAGGAARDRSRAGEHLVAACERVGGFACEVLGRMSALGEIDGTLEDADRAFRRACATGYPPACEHRAADLVGEAAGI